MIRTSHLIVSVLTGCLLWLGSGQVMANSPAKAKGASKLQIDLTVIQASKSGSIDPRLTPLKNELTRSFSGYQGFAFVEAHVFGVQHADSVVKRLKTGKAVAFSNMGKDGQKLRVRLDIDGANVMMKVREGELWFHARREKGSKALILAVRARSQTK